MTDLAQNELRPAYRTLNEPTRLLGVSLGGWAGLLVAGGVGYAFLAASPLPWRLNFSLVVVGVGGPALLLILREPGTIGPGRLLGAVFAWRLRSVDVVCPDGERPVRGGALRLDGPPPRVDPFEAGEQAELPWTADAAEAS